MRHTRHCSSLVQEINYQEICFHNFCFCLRESASSEAMLGICKNSTPFSRAARVQCDCKLYCVFTLRKSHMPLSCDDK